MRSIVIAAPLALIPAALALCGAPASAATHRAAKPTAQSVHCSQTANDQKLTGAQRADFIKTCLKGPMAAGSPTAPTASSKEAQAVTKPSGVDRTTRTRDCAAQADAKKLAGSARREFQMSCLATAAPASTLGAAGQADKPASQIKGIGVNNYKPSATTAKSTPTRPQP